MLLRSNSPGFLFQEPDSSEPTRFPDDSEGLPTEEGRVTAGGRSATETISFSHQRGGASLLDFLNARADYRSVQLNYLNLVASYLSAAGQLNLAVGCEVIP
jgi:hypothetical protein